MRNVTLNVLPIPNLYNSPAPVPTFVITPATPTKQTSHQVSFSAQFDNEADAIKFASELLSIVAGDGE